MRLTGPICLYMRTGQGSAFPIQVHWHVYVLRLKNTATRQRKKVIFKDHINNNVSTNKHRHPLHNIFLFSF